MDDDSVMSTSRVTPRTSDYSSLQSGSTPYSPETVTSLPQGIRGRLLHVGERVLGPTHRTSQSHGVPLPLGSVEAVSMIHRLLNGLGVHGYSAIEVENVWTYYARSKGGYQDPMGYPWSPVESRDGKMLAGASCSLDGDGGDDYERDEDLQDVEVIGNTKQVFENGRKSSNSHHTDSRKTNSETDTTMSEEHVEYKGGRSNPTRKRNHPPPRRLYRKRVTPSAPPTPPAHVSPEPDKSALEGTRRSNTGQEWAVAECCTLIAAIIGAAEKTGKNWEKVAIEVMKFSPKGIDRNYSLCKKTFAVTEKPHFKEFERRGLLYTPKDLPAAGAGPRSWTLDEKKALWKGLIVQGAKSCDWKEIQGQVNEVGKQRRSAEQVKNKFEEELKKMYL